MISLTFYVATNSHNSTVFHLKVEFGTDLFVQLPQHRTSGHKALTKND